MMTSPIKIFLRYSSLVLLLISTISFFVFNSNPVIESRNQGIKKSLETKIPSDWTQFMGNPMQQGHAVGSQVNKFELKWKTKLGVDLTSSASIKNNRLVIGSGDHHLYCLRNDTGQVLWKFETDDVIEASPLIYNGKVYVGSHDYHFYCLDLVSGKKVWSFETGGKIIGSANFFIDNEQCRIIVGSYDGNLYALDAEHGKMIWSYNTDNYINSSPAIYKNSALFGGCDENVHWVDLLTGHKLQAFKINSPIPGSGSVFESMFYVGNHEGAFFAFDLESHRESWSIKGLEEGVYATSAVSEQYLIITDRGQSCRAVDPFTGKILWKVSVRGAVESSPIVLNDSVFIGTKKGVLFNLNISTGEIVDTYDLGSPIVGSLSYANDTLFVPTRKGFLYAFGDRP